MSYRGHMLVFIPVSREELAGWASGTPLRPVAAYAVTSAFAAAFDLPAGEIEDAERTAMHVAALAALLRTGTRLVAVAGTPASATDGEWGEVTTGPVPWSAVTALFADEAGAADAVSSAASALRGATLDQAWGDPAHEALMESADLLWHGPEEWVLLAPGA